MGYYISIYKEVLIMKHIVKTRIKALVLIFTLCVSAIPMHAFAATPETQLAVQEDVNTPTVTITKISDDVTVEDEASTRESKTYVDRNGQLAPGESISGTFTLSGWFGIGNEFTVIAGAGNTGGSLGFSLAAAYYTIPCNGSAQIITRESGWSAGTYSYSINNPTSNTTGYALKIFKP